MRKQLGLYSAVFRNKIYTYILTFKKIQSESKQGNQEEISDQDLTKVLCNKYPLR